MNFVVITIVAVLVLVVVVKVAAAAVCSICCCSGNVPRARKELTNLSRYTSARRKLCCLRRVVQCLLSHATTTADDLHGASEHNFGLY